MPTTDIEKKLLRRETGDSLTSLLDEDVDLLFSKAETEYSAYSQQVKLQAVVVYRIDELLTASIPDVTYQQNETRENRSDIAKGLEGKLARARKRLDELIADEKAPAVAFGKMRKIPKPRKEYPRS
jgi:arginine deiminase